MARVAFRRMPSVILSSSRKCQNAQSGWGRWSLMGGQPWIIKCASDCISWHEAVALRSRSRVSSVRDGEEGSNCATCVRNTWKVLGMEGVLASSQHGALDKVSAKCSEEPFLYDTAKLYRCRKSIIFCKRLGAEARSF